MTLRLPASTPRATRSAAAEVAGEDRAGQAVLGVVGQRDRVRLVVERHHRDDRPEDLLAPDPGSRVVGEHHRRRQPEAVAARAWRPRTRPPPRRGSRCTESRCCAETSGPISLASSPGSSDLHAGDRRLEQAEELVVRRPLDEDPRAGAAVLAGVVEDGVRRAGGRGGQVGVGEDDVGALAAELEGHPLHLVGAAGHDLLADLGGAGEADLADQRVGDEPLADHRALARDDREHALGQPGLEGQLAEPDRGQRRDLGRLEHHRVAGGQRRGEAPAGDRHREVPRHDDADHAERLVEGDVDAAGDRDLPAEEPLRAPRSSS